MTPKRKNLNKSLSIDSQNNNPGAGTYEDIQTIVGPGKKYLSNHKKTLGRFYNPESPKRFDVPSIIIIICR